MSKILNFKYALNLDPETNRVLSACFVNKFTPLSMPRVNELPEGELYEYLYIDGKYIHQPLEEKEGE